MKRTGLFLSILVLGSILSVALIDTSAPVTPSEIAGARELEAYKKWHDICLQGDTKSIDAQIKKFEACLVQDPNDHLARVFLGSACALRAKAGIWGPTKLKYLRKGKKFMNSAVESAPDDPRVRMVRAIGYYRVPKRFKLRATCIEDFHRIVPIAKNPRGGLKVNERQAILYYAYLAYEDEKKPGSKELKALCHRIAPTSKYGKLTK